ncbi:MAG: exodeoxyribonuclease VII large subunit [Rikenellaceae bacterium]
MAGAQQVTLSQLQQQISKVITSQFALPTWVSAEISDIKVNYSGHCYLELVEKGESDGVAKAQARAVIWKSAYGRVAGSFEMQTGTTLERGVKILAKVVVNYHELYGMSLQIIEIDPSYTLGDMERQRQITISRLQKDGVWDMNREHKLPMLVQRIAVISSSSAAGYQDFCKELAQGGFHFTTTLFDSVMQGTAAEDSIVDSLYAIAEREDEFDIAIIIRGGGSTSDLNCFNSYALASTVAQFPLPIFAGIGHDKDTSVVDMVAHRTLKTPTAVAGWLNDRMSRIEGWLMSAAQTLHDTAIESSRRHELLLERYMSDISSEATQFLGGHRTKIDEATQRLQEGSERYIKDQYTRLDHTLEVIENYSPQRLLNLGFSILRAAGDGLSAIDSVGKIECGDEVVVDLHDGEITATVTAKRERKDGK